MTALHSKTTVLPIDFSDLSFDALEKAIEITGVGTIHVVHVLIKMTTMEPGQPPWNRHESKAGLPP